MRKLLFLLALLPTIVFSQNTMEPVTFRLDINDVIDNVPNSDSAQVFIQTNVASWVDIPMEDIGGNGIWRKNIFISYPTGQNIDVFYRFKITSFGNNGLPFTMWEGGAYVDTTCLSDPSTQGLAQGDIRQILFPQELINNGTYVNPTGEYKLTHCFNECGNAPCTPQVITYDSWLNIQFQTDNYPEESSWELLDSLGNIVMQVDGDSLNGVTLYDTTLDLFSGEYVLNLNDSYGDGLGASQWGGTDGWFLIQNDCQDTLTFVAGNFGSLYTDTLIMAPCAPPTGGCTDTMATNYDPGAAFEDGSCIYPPCSGLDTLWGEWYCNGPSVTLHWHWEPGENPNCQVISYSRTNNLNTLWDNGNVYQYPANWGNTGVMSSNKQPNTTYYFQAMLADSTLTDTVVINTGECNVGCTDPAALNYNPWANIDDGTCQLPPANCATGESNIVVTVIPDTYPDETSWEIADTTGTVLMSSPAYTQPGVPVVTETCVPNGTVIEFSLFDAFGDGLCGSCYGGTDGTVLVQTLCGDTILSILPGDANFGNDTITSPYVVQPCTPSVILGCTTPGFTEYNPQANTDDGTCSTPVVLGCTDVTSPDYDSTANTMQIIPQCQYTLTITDEAEDGWFGAWVGILQDTTILGPFMMGPNDGYSETFTISLSALSPVELMFFAPGQSATTANQCGFFLTGPEGDTTLSGGTNPWTDPMLQFPYKYSAMPYCGDYCTEGIIGCMDSTALNYNPLANMPDSCTPIILGCTNSLAFNYDPTANVDDASCVSIIIGCMDSTAFNFNPTANTNDQSSCIDVILGCMDDTMFNYNAAANTDDGTCIPVVFGCTDALAFNYDSTANTNNNSCLPVVSGCTDATAFNFNPLANTDDGTCIAIIYGCTDVTMFNYNSLANTDNGSCEPFIYGCMDSTAFNYDPLANTDNGTCQVVVSGCTNPLAINFDPGANTDDGSCINPVYGCTDSTMFNYNPLANTDNGTCEMFVYGCTNGNALNYNPLANTDDGSCILPVYGCTDSTMFNYNPLANTDNGTCEMFVYGCTDGSASNFNPLANTNDNSCYYNPGCTDANFLQFYTQGYVADFDDGSCIDSVVYGCTDPTMFNYDPLANIDNGNCIMIINGCTDSTMWNYDPLANTDNGTCIAFVYGCTDNTALNFNPLANTLDNSCCYIGGCTDSTALNYDPNACIDDNSCITIVTGCTDVGAYNYNPAANVSDSTACLYDAGCYGGPGVPYWLNDGCYAWVIDVDNYCCTDNWDVSCQSMYDYCQQGWPTGLDDITSLGIVVYPNPTENIITIETRLKVEVEVYDLMGRLVLRQNDKRVDLTTHPNGVYNLVLIHNNKRYNAKVIKQ